MVQYEGMCKEGEKTGKTTVKYEENRHSLGMEKENEYIGYWVHIIFE